MSDIQTILYECKKMVDLTGEVKATDNEFNYILEGMVVHQKGTIRKMSKDILNKPVFQLLYDWLVSDNMDYQINRQHIIELAEGYLRRYKDIFAVDLTTLYPLPAKKTIIETEEKKHGKRKYKKMPKLQRKPYSRRKKQ